MESQSMRRRQTVLGEQLQATNGSNSSQFLAVPSSAGNVPTLNVMDSSKNTSQSGSVGRHIRSFSHISTRGVVPAMPSSGMNTSATSLTVPGAQHDDTMMSDAVSISSVHSTTNDDFDPALMSSSIDPVTYLSRNLAGADLDEILKFGEKLKLQAQKAQDVDQRKLQNNYKLLSTVTSSIAKLAPAVAVLHKQVADLSLVSDAMRQDAFAAQAANASNATYGAGGAGGAGGSGASGGAGGLDAQRVSTASYGYEFEEGADDNFGLGNNVPVDRRQSMIVLNSAWSQDLNELYRRVDGAQRALPPAPGRHVVHEEPNWSELNLVTQKPVRPVLIVALNDFLLIAVPRQGKFVHAYHLALDETFECHLDDSNRSLKITSGTHQLGLLAPSLARLRVMYSELCKLVELAISRKRTTTVRGSSMRLRSGSIAPDTAAAAINNTPSSPPPAGTNIPRSRSRSIFQQHSHSRKPSHASIASIPEISVEQRREAARIIADLDRCIAHRMWAEATQQCIENEDDAIVGHLVRERRQKLADHLLDELNDKRMLLTREDKCVVVQQLTKLGKARDAKHALLDTAASEIERQAREVHFMGDVINYISQMAAIYFQTIIATVKVYRRAFPDKPDSSLAVAWVKSQVDIYAAIFNRQLFRIAPEMNAHRRCRIVSKRESSQLRELNMDMEFMLRYAWEN